MPAKKTDPDCHIDLSLADGTALSVCVRQSARAMRPCLRLHQDGALRLTVPAGTPANMARTFMDSFLPWLEQAWQKHQACGKIPAIPRSIDIPLLGTTFAIDPAGDFATGKRRTGGMQGRLITLGSQRLILHDDGQAIHIYGPCEDTRLVAHALRRWCRELAGNILPPHVRHLASQAGLELGQVRVRNQKQRWGSCACQRAQAGRPTSLPSINLNWRALLLPLPLLDHLCHHELGHIGHMDHSPAFHAHLERLSPGSAQKEKALNRQWRDLPWWTIGEA